MTQSLTNKDCWVSGRGGVSSHCSHPSLNSARSYPSQGSHSRTGAPRYRTQKLHGGRVSVCAEAG